MKPEIPPKAVEAAQSLTWQEGLLALAAFIGFVVVARLAGLLLRRVLSKHPHVGGSRFALSKLLSYFIVFIGLVTALSMLGLPLSSVILTSSALLVGIGFSLQTTARDVVAGIVLLVEQRIRKGDFVSFADISGTVQDIGLRSTCVLTRDGTTLVVPNNLLVTTELSNQSHPLQRARLHVLVPVAFDADIDAVERALFDVAEGHSEVLAEPTPIVRFAAAHYTHFELTLIVWVTEPTATLRIGSELRFAIARTFARQGLPFPTPELRVWGSGGTPAPSSVRSDADPSRSAGADPSLR